MADPETKGKNMEKIVLFVLVIFLIFTCFSLIAGIFGLNKERLKLEEQENLTLDPSNLDFEKLVLFGSSFITLIVLIIGLFGVCFKIFLILLFFSTTGIGLFILLVITLILENILHFFLGIVMIIFSLSTSSLVMYYAFEINQYKDLSHKVDTKEIN